MKLKALLPAILIAVGSSRAQVGIGTKTPESRLDVKGNITIGFEEDNPGKEGMVRWNKENTCLECHDGNSWRCIEYKVTQSQLKDGSIKTEPDLETDAQGEGGILSNVDTFEGNNETGRNCPECEITEGLEKPLLTLAGGEELRYNDGAGWSDNDNSNTGNRNVVKLNIKDGTKTSIYDPQSGTITIDQDGTYKFAYKVQLVNHLPGEVFDESDRLFGTWININKRTSSRQGIKVLPGDDSFDISYDKIIYLKKDDKLRVRFLTWGTRNMNTDTNNIYINKNRSYIVLWRL